MVAERDLSVGGERTMPCVDDVLYNVVPKKKKKIWMDMYKLLSRSHFASIE